MKLIYIIQGKNCETNHDDCEPDPCENGGVCVDLEADYQCQCQVAFFFIRLARALEYNTVEYGPHAG
jgi:hypothetical protein